MAGGGHSLHKNDWLKIGALTAATVATAGMASPAIAAAAAEGSPALLGAGGGAAVGGGSLGAGAAAAGGAGGLLGTGTLGSNAARGIGGVAGPSDFTAALAGDAYMPAAAGADGSGSAGIGNMLGGGLRSPSMGKNLFNAARFANAMQPKQAQANNWHPQGGPVSNTNIYAQPGGVPGIGQGTLNDEYWKRFQQGGY